MASGRALGDVLLLWAAAAVVWLLPHLDLSLRAIAPLGLTAAICRTLAWSKPSHRFVGARVLQRYVVLLQERMHLETRIQLHDERIERIGPPVMSTSPVSNAASAHHAMPSRRVDRAGTAA